MVMAHQGTILAHSGFTCLESASGTCTWRDHYLTTLPTLPSRRQVLMSTCETRISHNWKNTSTQDPEVVQLSRFWD